MNIENILLLKRFDNFSHYDMINTCEKLQDEVSYIRNNNLTKFTGINAQLSQKDQVIQDHRNEIKKLQDEISLLKTHKNNLIKRLTQKLTLKERILGKSRI